MNAALRTPLDTDWPAILKVAHQAAPWAGDQNSEWLLNRQHFDQRAWRRRHYVAEDKTTGFVIGYGAVEEGPLLGVFRVFVVMSPERLTSGLGQYLYDRLHADLEQMAARGEWVQEEARNTVLLGFFALQPFEETRRATIPDGLAVVVMERHWPPGVQASADGSARIVHERSALPGASATAAKSKRSSGLTLPDDLASRYPHLFREVLWPWGPSRARFVLLESAPPDHQISSVNIVPHIGKNWVTIRLKDGSWDIPGGTREPGEHYLDTAHRELAEEAGARLISFRVFGAWHCVSLAERPFRPHLPFPESFRVVGVGDIELVGAPENPRTGETVVSVESGLLAQAIAHFQAAHRYDLAELYHLAAHIRLLGSTRH